MSSTVIIVLIIVLLVALMTYAFISQTMAGKREQRQRLLSALNQRARNFKQIINGFPPGYLNRELNVLVHNSLLEVIQQQAELQGKKGNHVEELALYSRQLETIKRQPKNESRGKLQNPHQVKEVRALLQDLQTFLGQQAQKGKLPKQQFQHYEAEIRQMVVRVTADSYLLSARQAAGSGKDRLAVHYYTLARKLLVKESKTASYAEKLAGIDSQIERLQENLDESEPGYEVDKKNQVLKDEAAREWDQFSEQGESGDWKKKSIYD